MLALEFSPADPAALPLFLGGSLAEPRIVGFAAEACHFMDEAEAWRFWEEVRATFPHSAEAWGEPRLTELWKSPVGEGVKA